MNGNQLVSAYTEIALDDLYPVIGLNATGVDSTLALVYLNMGARRVMRSLRRQAKATFNFIPATVSYNITTASNQRFFEISKVLVNNTEVPRVAMDDTTTNGYYIIGDTLTFMQNYGTAYPVQLFGFVYSADIAASATEITDIPLDLHIAIAQLAIIEACGSHENTPDQIQRLQNMQVKAEDSIARQNRRDGMNTFPTSLTNGSK